MRLLPLAVLFVSLALLAVVAWAIASTPGAVLNQEPALIVRPTPRSTEVALVTVFEGESAKEIGDNLETEEVIQSEPLFRIMVTLMGIEDELVAGDYEFDRGLTTLEVIGRIRWGITLPLVVTVPEGLRAEEIGLLMEEKGVVSGEDFGRALATGEYDFDFLAQRPTGLGLEGYLFPATYGFSRRATARGVVEEMLAAFEEQVADELDTEIAASGLTLHEALTLASVVEREAVLPEERPVIASVFLNRLSLGLPLQADPTVQYAVGSDRESVRRYGYWKRALTEEDLQVESLYNTYRVNGLPPGPIANPGVDSVRAVVRPTRTNYLFFVAKDDGSHVFAETLEEHQRNVDLYQR
jgi:UPF0755 protein